jgi:hypothetical protein
MCIIVITALFHSAMTKMLSKVKMIARVSCERHFINAQCFKVMRTPISPLPCKLENVAVSFVLYFVVF